MVDPNLPEQTSVEELVDDNAEADFRQHLLQARREPTEEEEDQKRLPVEYYNVPFSVTKFGEDYWMF